ncbi:DNA polymerase III delta prime subunit [Cutibacterium acnes JCM 18916]|nr:DNA polymerase III delta prime subunit [Cutibacterium acnes JCM 18916]
MRDATPLVSSLRLRSLGDCLQAAEDLVNQASEEAAAATAEVNAAERAELKKAWDLAPLVLDRAMLKLLYGTLKSSNPLG